MIGGGSSSGSPWSFFRSSSSNSSQSSSPIHDSTSSTASTSTSASTSHPQDGEPPQSGNKELRSAVTAPDDLPPTNDAIQQADSAFNTALHRVTRSGPSCPSSSLSAPNVVVSPSPTNIQAPLGSPPSQSLPYTAGPSLFSSAAVPPEELAPSSASSPSSSAPAYHLHSLTERKLEKAVLGRAVGLRQLVLLSNAFASRPAVSQPLPAPEETSLRFPYASTSQRTAAHSFYEDEEVLDYEEDEAERKRREEDWLDSVLDEMLTDAEDEEDDDDGDNNDEGRTSGSYHSRVPTRSEREFREPYVHLSIKHSSSSWHSSFASSSASSPPSTRSISSSNIYATQSPSTSLIAQHAALLEEESTEDTQHMEISPPSLSPLYSISEEEHYWPSDSGFMEPCSIPLPVSTEASPNSSAHSQANSDDGHETDRYIGPSRVSQGGEAYADDDACHACEMASEGTRQVDKQVLGTQDNLEYLDESQGGIPISSTNTSAPLASPHSFTCTSLPELAYSANSFNTISSCSPSHSFSLYTPGTSPPATTYSSSSLSLLPSINSNIPTQAEREKQAWRESQNRTDVTDFGTAHLEPQDIMLPMDDLDIYDEQREDERSSTSSREDEEKTSSSGSTTSNEDRTRHYTAMTRRLPSLELVRYGSKKIDEQERNQEDDALRIPLYLPLSASGPDGLFGSRTFLPEQNSTMPALPPSLLSVMMGKTPAVAVELQSTPGSMGSSKSKVDTSSYGSTFPSPAATSHGRIDDKLRLPIFLPSEIVKSLYDSVDFGIPQCISSPTSSPLASPLQVPLDLPFDGSSPPTSPSSSSRISSRSRSKSLTLLDPVLPTSSQASPGGLLFSSLGLFGIKHDENDRETRGDRTGIIWDQTCASQRRRSLSSTPLDMFARVSKEDYASVLGNTTRTSRNMLNNAARNESRSPSRLRLLLDHGDSFADDFEFGSI